MRTKFGLFLLPLLCGCASTPELPVVPEYHPAHAEASQAPRLEAFDVLDVAPVPQPELPVPPAVELPPQDPEKMKGMQQGHGGHEMKGASEGDQHQKGGKLTTTAPEGSVEETAGEHLHGVVEREGMLQPHPESMPGQGQRQDHPRPQDTLYKEQLNDDVKRMEAPMQHIKIPSEQRGMGADSEVYHEHKHHDSTHITHPDRSLESAPVGGKQVWACPSHPEVTVQTPGGRCPHCDTVLVPVRVEP